MTIAAAEGQGQVVLVVDDDRDHVEVLQGALADAGYTVRTADDGATGMRSARKAPPDLILMDVNMSELDGTAAAQQLRQDPVTRHVPIIFVSGAPDLVPRMRELSMDDTDFLQKPYSVEQLLVRIQRSFQNTAVKKRLREDANQDELTHLGNLRLLRERMTVEEARLDRYGIPTTMIVLDIDKLKDLNDNHGHAAGDAALKAVADVLAAEVRDTDLAVRYGGDEFVVLLPHTTLSEGLVFADRVVRQVRELRADGAHITASLGVDAREKKESGSFATLLAHADAAVYQAKHAGGDQVCRYQKGKAQ